MAFGLGFLVVFSRLFGVLVWLYFGVFFCSVGFVLIFVVSLFRMIGVSPPYLPVC